MAFNKAVLCRYAQLDAPQKLPPNIYFVHTEHTVTVFDVYPKAVFHFLVLPRIKDKEPSLSSTNLTSLKTFLNAPKTDDAKEMLKHLKEDGEQVREMIVEEMRTRYGFVWDVYIGFHAVQSMDHIHLHIISEDLCAPGLKTKKHYNSFHPKLGFFLHLDDVLSWFEDGNAESYTQSMIKLDESPYEKKLKQPLECFRCAKELKNIPTLKTHLQEHFDKIEQKGKAAEADRKRKHGEEDQSEEDGAEEPSDPDLKQEEAVTEKRKAVVLDSSIEASPQGENSSSGDDDDAAPRKKQKSV